MKKFVVLLLMLFLVAGISSAQNKSYSMKNVWEFKGSIGFSSVSPVTNGNTGDANTEINLGLRAGYFVINGLSIGVEPNMTYSKPSAGPAYTDYTLYFAPAYTFYQVDPKKKMLYPYIMGLVGYSVGNYNGNVNKGLAIGGEAGLDVIPWGNGLINIFLRYENITRNPDPNPTGNRYGWNSLSAGVGLGIFL